MCRKSRQLHNSIGEQGFSPCKIVSQIVMKRSCYLDDALKECLFRLRSVQPEFFPGFVSLEEKPLVKLVDSKLEFFVFVFRNHSFNCLSDSGTSPARSLKPNSKDILRHRREIIAD